MSNQLEKATLGGGCFWCTEAIFREVEGVEEVYSGYSGGDVPGQPTYREVCSGRTGHAEVIQLSFDPTRISYKEILEIFMTTHDPTTLNRQGADVGTQYRSVIFYHNEEQKDTAEKALASLQAYYEDPIVTEISPLEKFYMAEDYHQDYYKNNPNQGYCNFVISPKLTKFRKKYAARLKSAT